MPNLISQGLCLNLCFNDPSISYSFKLILQTAHISSTKAYNSITAAHAKKKDIMKDNGTAQINLERYQEAIDNDCFFESVFIEQKIYGEKIIRRKEGKTFILRGNKLIFIVMMMINFTLFILKAFYDISTLLCSIDWKTIIFVFWE